MAQTFDLAAKATVSATGQGGSKAVAGVKELLVMVELSDEVTTPVLTVYLQSSWDGGATWFDIHHQGSTLTAAAAAEPAAEPALSRNILDARADNEKWSARYTEFGTHIRLAHVFSGAGSFDLAAKAIGK
jgi:hypothetical protein